MSKGGWWRCHLCKDSRRHYTRRPDLAWIAHYHRQHYRRKG